MDALVDVIVRKYAPLPERQPGQFGESLAVRGTAMGWGTPRGPGSRQAATPACARVEGIEWYWPAEERPQSARWRLDDAVRLLTPFDPVVWDRRRFEIFWNWIYRFEAYTPAPKRKLGYYALPLLWHERVIGWGNVAVTDGRLRAEFGYTDRKAPRNPDFRAGLEAELERVRAFLRALVQYLSVATAWGLN